jgi:outer membrane biosynthesis protein TonB
MSEPRKETAEQPVVAPSVSADPGRGPWRLSRIPSHLGRARTSTLVLGLLFLAIGALYLNIRPDPPATAQTPTSDTGIVQPAPPPTEEPTPAPEPTPTPTEEPTETTDDVPTTTAEPTPTEEPTETTTPEETTETSVPTFSSPSRPGTSSPTVVSPPG